MEVWNRLNPARDELQLSLRHVTDESWSNNSKCSAASSSSSPLYTLAGRPSDVIDGFVAVACTFALRVCTVVSHNQTGLSVRGITGLRCLASLSNFTLTYG